MNNMATWNSYRHIFCTNESTTNYEIWYFEQSSNN